ncbi:hypothetical protein DBR06_SOUSAS4210008 [Sousa chinensis]|nr:hypothetical protein DBR06_SOUSAS4210008 [Sousa chinensis]
MQRTHKTMTRYYTGKRRTKNFLEYTKGPSEQRFPKLSTGEIIPKITGEGSAAPRQEVTSPGLVVPVVGRKTRERTQTPPHRTLRYDPELEASEEWRVKERPLRKRSDKKWRRESCPIDRSGRTFTAHAQRASRRALRYRLTPLAPALLAILRARSRDSFTSSDFISDAATLTPRDCCLTDKCQTRRAPRALERPQMWRAFASITSGALRSKCACAPSPPGRDSSRRVGFEPMKMQRLSSPDQSAFGFEGLTPI